ncbi:MAG: AMP-binding protein [Alphaproteobacteria bacterium]|nr:AMP-binding protein [Alphaproteobacteria bacterium]
MPAVENAMLHPEIERLDRDAILAIQREKLATLGARLANSPDWVEHFAAAGMAPADLAAADGLAHAPTLEKADLHARYPFPLLGAGVNAVAKFFATSGTTGLPVMFGFTGDDLTRLGDQVARLLACMGVKPGALAYNGYGYGLWMGGPAFDLGLQRLGATCFPVGPGRGELVVEWLRDQAWDFAAVSPLWMMTLTRLAREAGIEPKRDWRLSIAGIGGQSVSQAFREELEAALPEGFRAHNVYGTTEAGGPILSTPCPHSHGEDEMHLVNEDSVISEILDPETLKPVGPGEVGEIVVTTLDKHASPMVRWRTRDLVRLSDKPYDCACGRSGMPRIGRIIGRSDDMLKVRGVIVYPSQIEDVIAATPGTVKEAWQIYVTAVDKTHDTITVAVEAERGFNGDRNDLAKAIGRALTSRLGLRVPVECQPEGTLPRYEAKAQRVLVREQ